MSVAFAAAVMAALTIGAIAYWYQKSTKLPITGLAVTPSGGLLISVPSTGFTNKMYGRKLVVSTQSLGRVVTTLCSYAVLPTGQATVVATSDGAYTGTAAYQASSGDHLLISSM